MVVGIFGRNLEPNKRESLRNIFMLLNEKDVQYVIYEPFAQLLQFDFLKDKRSFNNFDEVSPQIDLLLSIGGDGTMLDAVSLIGVNQKPILGVNFGSLGFLTSTSIENFEASLKLLLSENYLIDHRDLLEVNANHPLFGSENFGLNEFTIQRKDTSSLITVEVSINGEFINSYWSDGLIIATATGSTAYSLSCGGPILSPDSQNFVLTSISPHNLNARPLVVPNSSVISLRVKGRSEQFLVTLDTRVENIDKSFEITVKKSFHKIQLIRFAQDSFVNALRNKLMWGMDQRN